MRILPTGLIQPDTGINSEILFPGGPDDYAANTSTTGSVSVGGSTTGELEIVGDNDWFALTLSAGQTVQINVTGLSLFDPIMGIYNSAGSLLTQDDDGGSGFNSQLTFTATTAGTYYVAAAGFAYTSGSPNYPNIGTYSVSVQNVTGGGQSGPGGNAGSVSSPTSNPLLQNIDWGTQIDNTGVVNVLFAGAGYSADGYTSEGFNAYEIAQFGIVFDLIESITNLTFNIVTSNVTADFVVLLDTNEILGGFLGYFNPPGTFNEGVGVFDGTSWDRFAGGDLEQGGFGFVTIVHEFLHGLGLAHPHDSGGSSNIMDGVTAAFDDFGDDGLNQGIFTTMSYNSGYHTGPSGTAGDPGGNWGFEGGPMAIDIAALQENYGANTSYNTGNNTYLLPSSNTGGTMWHSIWDAGGIDTIRQNGGGAATIDLRAATITESTSGGGYISMTSGVAGGFTIANGVVIENAVGGGSNDSIRGNTANNNLNGGGGFDTILGEAGNDTLIGGAGADSLRGGTGNDRLDGGDGFDNIYGEAGNDTLLGGATADRLYGGDDDDLIRAGSNFGITVDGLFGEAGNDTLYGDGGFDFLDGGSGNDLMDGGHQADNLYGRSGDDTLLGGDGLDRLFGGADNDSASGGAGNDGLFGEQGNDTLNGDTGNDRFFGGTGNDLIDGGSGNDSVFAGAGFDTIDGGIGNDLLQGDFNADRFVFDDGHGADTITDFAATNVFERIDFSALSTINTLGQALAASSQVGADVLIDTGGGNSILLLGVNLGDLDATDFVF